MTEIARDDKIFFEATGVRARVPAVDDAIATGRRAKTSAESSNCRLFSSLDHHVGKGDVSFVAKRFRHRAIATHQVPAGIIVTACPG